MPLKNRGSEGALNALYQNDEIFIKSLTNCKKEVRGSELEVRGKPQSRRSCTTYSFPTTHLPDEPFSFFLKLYHTLAGIYTKTANKYPYFSNIC